ncbi:efflux transporter periplasmic adaptor subunit [Leptolyngbya sp. 'hensonii']|uniref:efflux RND transporter periplasmic adaptor subunit n=1 Tax=Leptolyngbya sp. 'hensonii' TaxID=1922337 RepID=UPI00094F4F32|nr:efflux RND transporter periplasmic adaptor subunit [Leptolyngbya sp. 'hensonii']OLP16229.1 efflux transporter periplasmic adaptor subunit [Leptolyngbya sp. 'hensonii']
MKVSLPVLAKIPRSLGIVLIIGAIVGTGIVLVLQRTTQQPQPRQDVTTVPVKTENLPVRINASGTVTPVQEVNISPKASGRLVELLVDQGDRVGTGQIIARMEDAEFQARLDEAQAVLAQSEARLAELQNGSRPEEIAQAQARFEQAESRLDQARRGSRSEEIAQAQAQVDGARSQLLLAQTRSTRYRSLAQQGALARDQLDEVLTNERNTEATLRQLERRLEQLRNGSRPEEITQAEAAANEARQVLRQLQNGTRVEQIAQAQAQVAQAAAQVRAAETQVDDTVIRAPFNGVITQKYANVGAFVTPTTSASATSSATSSSIVAIAGRLEILAKIAESDIAQIQVGQKVEIRTAAFPGQVFQGEVRLIAPAAILEQNVTSFQTRVSLKTGQKQLRSGMNVDLIFVGKPIRQALVVPTVAIVTRKGKTGVLVTSRGKGEPEFRPVLIGYSTGDQTQVVQGLKVGESVVVYTPQSRPERPANAPTVRF